MNNHPNHPLYNPLGNPPNIHLLDSMFGMQAAEQHKPTIIPQYAAYQDMHLQQQQQQAAAAAMNLAQSSHVVTSISEQTAPQVVVYQQVQEQQQQQQQPISYKIPQIGTTTASSSQQMAAAAPRAAAPPQIQAPPAQTIVQEVDSKKDIVAEATSKIFEDVHKKPQTAEQSSAASGPVAALPTAIKSEPVAGPSDGGDTKPVSAASAASTSSSTPSTNTASSAKPGPKPGSARGRPAGRGGMVRQQIMPRLSLLEEEDDGLTCRMCLQSFWFKRELLEHLKTTHSITEPDRYEREERDKKLRRIREEQQRAIIAKRQRMAAQQGRGGARGGRVGGRIMGKPTAGPRPSFQYRDGAFICDLCKKSFSDGNDMVTHWKSHVKKQRQQQAQMASRHPMRVPGRRGRPPSGGGRGRPPMRTHYTSRGRPITKKSAGRNKGSEDAEGGGGGRGRGGRAGRSDKGKPRWTSYLVWSTRRRKELTNENPDLTFAEVAKNISNEWKEVSGEDKDRYQEEAEDMNAQGIRKLPTSRPNSSASESDSESSEEWDSDPDFDQKKPIMLKIKKEGGEDARSARKRKRPSFFQEFENEENNLDKILDDFELEQIEESKKPKAEKKPPKAPGTSSRRRRKRTPSPEEPQEPVELETSRSGRVRKKIKFFDPTAEEDDPEDGLEDEDGSEDEEFKLDSEEEKKEEEEEEEEEEDDIEDEEEEVEEEFDEDGNKVVRKISLPPKKRNSKKLMTDAEIEEATKAAMSAKPVVMLNNMGDDDDEDEEDETGEKKKKKEESENGGEKEKSYKVSAFSLLLQSTP